MNPGPGLEIEEQLFASELACFDRLCEGCPDCQPPEWIAAQKHVADLESTQAALAKLIQVNTLQLQRAKLTASEACNHFFCIRPGFLHICSRCKRNAPHNSNVSDNHDPI
eukprot:3640283-Rhodomonas_salina.1